MNNQFLEEAFKEFLRTMIFGLVTIIIAALSLMLPGINQATGEININWAVIYAVSLVQFLTILGTALGSALDKFKHLEGRQKVIDTFGESDGKSHGIIKM